MGTSQVERLLRLATAQGIVTTGDVVRAGIHTETLSRLVRAGKLERVARGQYRLPDSPVT